MRTRRSGLRATGPAASAPTPSKAWKYSWTRISATTRPSTPRRARMRRECPRAWPSWRACPAAGSWTSPRSGGACYFAYPVHGFLRQVMLDAACVALRRRGPDADDVAQEGREEIVPAPDLGRRRFAGRAQEYLAVVLMLDQAPPLELVQGGVHGGLGDAELAGDIGHAGHLGPLAKQAYRLEVHFKAFGHGRAPGARIDLVITTIIAGGPRRGQIRVASLDLNSPREDFPRLGLHDNIVVSSLKSQED